MKEIQELLTNGNWSDAIEKYKLLNISPREFSEYLANLCMDELEDFALLGYYVKEKS